jgi:hypothetical protein
MRLRGIGDVLNFLHKSKSAGSGEPRRLWLDMGDLGDLVNPAGPHEQWQDHGLGLLRTLMHQAGLMTDIASTRAVTSWRQLRSQIKDYDVVFMNVRSYTFPGACKSAEIFKEVNQIGRASCRERVCQYV